MKKIIFLLCFCILLNNAAFALDEVQTAKKQSRAEMKLEKIKAKKMLIIEQNKAKKAAIDAKEKEQISKIEAIENSIKSKEKARLDKITQKDAAIKAKDDAKNEAARIKKEAKEARIAAKAQARELKLSAIAQAKELEMRAKEQEKAAIAQARELKSANKTGKIKVENKVVVLKETSKEPAPKDTNMKPIRQLKELNTQKQNTDKKQIVLVSYKGANFETKKTEITSGLHLSEKQQAEAEKIYTSAKEKISIVNIEIEGKQKEIAAVKMSKIALEDQAEKIGKLNAEIDLMYQKRDKTHNDAMKKFDNILDDEQLEAWNEAKTKGVRFFAELDEIK